MSTSEQHRKAERLMSAADVAASEGRSDEAARLFRVAAATEAAAVDEVPPDRPRTRGALALSSVALYRKAGDLDVAVRQGHWALAQQGLSEEARGEIELLMDEMRTEQIAGRIFEPEGFLWSLRGGRVGRGYASIETVSRSIDQIQRYAWRIFEFASGRQIRTTTGPGEDVKSAVQLMVGQPTAGSYNFALRLAGHQLSLGVEEPTAHELAEAFGRVLEAALAEDEVLDDVVPDSGYRDAFLRLVKGMAPDGDEVQEVEVRRLGRPSRPMLLTRSSRQTLGRRLRGSGPSTASPEEVVVNGVLRVIDLNRQMLRLGPKEDEIKVKVPDGMVIVDEIAGLEDKPVVVTGVWRGRVLHLRDIEADVHPGVGSDA